VSFAQQLQRFFTDSGGGTTRIIGSPQEKPFGQKGNMVRPQNLWIKNRVSAPERPLG